jgi:succinate dehydrogenase/fumarate reductase flavoprotein subunit
MRTQLDGMSPANGSAFNMTLQDWYDLRSGLLTAESVTLAAINRTESRGAHQREDFEQMDPAQTHNQRVRLNAGGELVTDYLSLGKGAAA